MIDTKYTLLQSAARFFSGTMLSRLSGLLRDMALAYAFGTQSHIAALLVAFRFAHLFRRLFGEGAMQAALIPHFESLRQKDQKRAGKFFCDLNYTLILLLLGIIFVCLLGLGGLLSLDCLSPGNAEIAWLTLLMMPSLLFICLFGINAALLQCERHYFMPSVAPIFFNLAWILGIFCSQNLLPTHAMSVLAVFIVLACLAQWLATLPATLRVLRSFGIQSCFRGTERFSIDVQALIKPLTLGMIGVAAAQINNALDAIFARWATSEGPAILWYAIRLQQLPLALFGVAIAGSLLPPLSRAIKEKNPLKFAELFNFALSRSLALMLPMTAILLLVGDQAIHLIYGRGDFGTTSVIQTTHALWGYSLGLLPMTFVMLLAPAYYAHGNYRTPTIAAGASMLLNMALNTLMVGGLGLGPTSIALATSLSAWMNMAWLIQGLKSYQLNILNPIGIRAAKVLLATLIAAACTIVSDALCWQHSSALAIASNQTPLYAASFFAESLHLCSSTALFLSVLAISAWGLKAKELTHFISMSSLEA